MPRTVAELVEEIKGLLAAWPEAPPEIWADYLDQLEQATQLCDTEVAPNGEAIRRTPGLSGS
jgi:hypothetical protein